MYIFCLLTLTYLTINWNRNVIYLQLKLRYLGIIIILINYNAIVGPSRANSIRLNSKKYCKTSARFFAQPRQILQPCLKFETDNPVPSKRIHSHSQNSCRWREVTGKKRNWSGNQRCLRRSLATNMCITWNNATFCHAM